jgi:hypothetical protein
MLSSECRKYAIQCIEIADTARPEHRDLLLELAQKWLEIAAEKARMENNHRAGNESGA